MKHLLLFFLTCIAWYGVHAQTTYITSEQKQVCHWDSTEQKFSICTAQEEFQCMFTLNAEQTMFTHTTPGIKSSYYIQSKKYEAESDCYDYEVTSDVGNKYKFIIGNNAANVVILSTGHEIMSNDYIVKFTIKKKWSE